ncbi:MAG: hypothetical protein HON47_01625 [Candidatus Diapherotrites archaeon]|jgi:hypothetical protein|uniref:Uncharacterized protein n=1 Tax=Candidatus Iainarchaeum sp. TaxID=3101447 RepID=A0A8T5GEB2_9ARCH|nr:hypothetical protein [Candidatus Diapherotrites archaeon]MBT7241692.1 hypothetical protein [Candidatus Diapherotrites archaeon]
MEQTILLKGIALFATLTGIQQWLSRTVALFDIIFIVLIVAFLISVELDYQKHKEKGRADNPQPSRELFLRPKLNLA